ncbi:hypothetical protein JL722_9274 [Aureococcus anophagefferens]|nr:hypothetical protein JL722_9274 [Aureococcus anophagefferens]
MMTPMGEKVRAPKQGGLEVGATVATLLLLVATSVWTFNVQQLPNFQIKLDVAWTITDLGQTVGGGSYVLVRKYGVWKLSCQLWKHGGRALGALMYALSCRFHALTFLGRAAFVDVACIIIFVAVGRFAGRVEVKPFVYESTPEMHFSLNFAGRPARGVLAYCLTVIVGQALTHGVLVVLEACATGDECEIEDDPAFLEDDASDDDDGQFIPKKTKTAIRDPHPCVSFVDDDDDGELDVARTVFVLAVAGLGFAALGYSLRLSAAPTIMSYSFRSDVNVRLRDVYDYDWLPPELKDQILLHFDKHNDHDFSTWDIIAAARLRRPFITFLFQLAHFFVVVAPLARVACLGAACVVPSRVARVVLRGVVDVVSIFVAADAFLLALGVTIVDLRSMLYEFTNQQLPVSLEDSLTVDIHAKTAWFFALFALVVGESVVSYRVARPFVDAMIRGDWRHHDKHEPTEATPLLPP